MVVIFWIAAVLFVALVLIFIVRPVFDRQLSDQNGDTTGGHRRGRHIRMSLVFGAGLVPIALVVIYLQVGSIALIRQAATQNHSQPSVGAERRTPEDQVEMIEGMVEGLATRLEQNPDDFEGWRMLARSQVVLGRLAEAEISYRRLLSVSDREFQDWSALADVQVALSEEEFPTNKVFMETLEQIDRRWSNHPYVLYYRGAAKRAHYDYDGALEDWHTLLDSIPETQPARASLQELIRETESLQRSGKSVPE